MSLKFTIILLSEGLHFKLLISLIVRPSKQRKKILETLCAERPSNLKFTNILFSTEAGEKI